MVRGAFIPHTTSCSLISYRLFFSRKRHLSAGNLVLGLFSFIESSLTSPLSLRGTKVPFIRVTTKDRVYISRGLILQREQSHCTLYLIETRILVVF